MYFDDILVSNCEIRATKIRFLESVYFGGDLWTAGPVGAKLDNIQMFNKALAVEQITELALANEGVLVG